MANYRVVVVTGNVPFAGTDANVFLTLFGEMGDSSEFTLDNEEDNFERNKTDIFSLTSGELGELRRVRIRHDNSGDHSGWFLDRITIHNEDTGREWECPCNRWLATDEDDHQIDRVLQCHAV
jgi:hypothetical protein